MKLEEEKAQKAWIVLIMLFYFFFKKLFLEYLCRVI